MARDARLQDARSCPAVALSRLYAVHRLRRRAPQARGTAVAAGQRRARRTYPRGRRPLSATRRRVERDNTATAARALDPRCGVTSARAQLRVLPSARAAATAR